MPNRDTHPAPPREKRSWSEMKENARHIDGGVAYEAVEKYVKSLPDKEITAISPSMLGGCPRVHWLKLKGFKETVPLGTGTKTTFEVGKQYEQFMADVFEHTGQLERHYEDGKDNPIEAEIAGVPFKGLPDFLIDIDGALTVADAKTQRSDSFQYCGPTQEELRKDKEAYWIQTVAYIMLLNANGATDVKQGLFFLYNKDNGIPQREMLVQPTEEDYQEVKRRAQLIWRHFKEDTLPPCDCHESTWKLEYCNFGTPDSRYQSKSGKTVNHECCELEVVKANQPQPTLEPSSPTKPKGD